MELKPWLDRCPLVAILRGVRPHEVLGIAAALDAQGIAIVEVPLNSPDPFESIRLLAAEFGHRLLVGAGTVMTPDDVARIAAAGFKPEWSLDCGIEELIKGYTILRNTVYSNV